MLSTLEKGLALQTVNVNNLPRLIIMDTNISEEKGLDLCRTWRGDRRTQKVPILITGRTSSEAAGFQALGITDFLLKPFKFEQLTAMVAKILQYGTSAPQVQKKTAAEVIKIWAVSLFGIFCVLFLILILFGNRIFK